MANSHDHNGAIEMLSEHFDFDFSNSKSQISLSNKSFITL